MMRKHILWIVILISLVYLNALSGGFVYDDYAGIVDNGFIKSARNIPLVFSKRYLTHPLEAAFNLGAYNIGSGEGSYRPVATLSYFLNYSIFRLDPFGWRLTNLAIHILCAILIYLLLNIIFSKPPVSLFSALIFGLHPVNAEVISCTIFRSNSLALLFSLLAISLYFRFRQEQGKTRHYYLITSLAAAFLAVFSKEIAVILPLALILCEYYRLKCDWPAVLKNFKIYSLYFLVDAVYIIIYFAMMPPAQGIFSFQDIYLNLMRMFDVTGLYLKGILLPASLLLIDPTEIFRSFGVSLLGISALVLAVYAIVKKNKFAPEVSFGVIWFWLWLLPMNNFINTFRITAAYRYLYVAMPGFAVLAGFILSRIWLANTSMPVLQRLIPLACLGYFSIFTVSANASWKNDMILNMLVAEKNPHSIYAHINFGDTLLKYGDIEGAKKELSFVLVKPRPFKYGTLETSVAYSNLGSIYMVEGRYAKAEEMYRQALALTPHVAYIYAKLGYCYTQRGLYKQALGYFNQAKGINPDFAPAYLNAGITYVLMKKYAQARAEFTQALKINPDYEQARNNLRKLAASEKGK